MIVRRLSHLCAGMLAVGIVAAPAWAQEGSSTPGILPSSYPPALPARTRPGPMLVFQRVGEIALPGPLAGRAIWAEDGVVVIPIEGGVARVAAQEGAIPVFAGRVEPVAAAEWLTSPNGKRRYRTTTAGVVEAERSRRGGKKKWKRAWRIAAPNSILAPPILLGPRLCYAGLDDRVTCVKARNGHRLWAVDLGDRLSRSLTCWPSCAGTTSDDRLLLVVPDDGASVVALDAYDGRRVAAYELPSHHRFASSALVAAGAWVAIASKGYDEREAALVLLRLAPAPSSPAAPSSPVPYNGDSPSRIGPTGR